MTQTVDYYMHNPLIHRDRRLGQSTSAWVRSFASEDLKPLIVCRGPIRKEAMDVYTEMGISHFGILLSEKDSIVYTNALAPELRQLTDSRRVHRVPDYSGASKEERVERIHQIIRIAKDNGYDSIFAGYGFMAEDDEFVAAIEKAGLKFIGPCAATLTNPDLPLEELADHILYASYEKGVDLFSIEELCAQVQIDVADMFKKYPKSRVRLKAIG